MAMNMNAALNIKANVEGTNNIVALNRGLAAVEGTAKGVTGAMRGLAGASSGLSGALGALAPLASVAGLVGLAKNALDAGDALNDMSQRTGVSVEALARFKKAAAVSGTDIETVAKGLNKLSKNMLDAATGNDKAAASFAAMQIKIKDANGQLKSSDRVMLELADRFSKMKDSSVKTGLAMDLFGKKFGPDLIPMLNMGGDAIDKLSVKMTTAFAQKADEYKDKLAILSGKVGALGADLLIALLPALNAITDAVTTAVDAFNTLPGPIKGLAVAGAMLAIAWGPLTGIVGGVTETFLIAKGAMEALRVQIALAAMEGIPALDAAILSIPGWGWALAGIAALTALGAALYNNSKGFKNWADTSINFIKVLATDGAGTMQKFGNWLGQQWNALVNLSKGTGNGIAGAFSNAFLTVATNAKKVFGVVADQIVALYNLIPAPLRAINEKSFAYLQGAWKKASGMTVVDGGGGNTQTGNMPGGFTPNLSALTPGGKGSPEAETERKKLQLDSARASMDAKYILDQQQINDLKRVGNSLSAQGYALKALEVQKSEAILEGQLEVKKVSDDLILKLKESADSKEQGNRKERDALYIKQAAVKQLEVEAKVTGRVKDINQQILDAQKKQAEEQAKAIGDINNRAKYAKIGALQGSEAEQRQRELDDLLRQQQEQPERADDIQKRIDALKQSWAELDALANNAGFGFAKGIRGYLEGIGTLADNIANVTKNVFQGLEDKLVEFVTTGKASFKDFANEIIKQLIRIAIQQAIMKPLLQGIGSLFSFGGGGGGGLGSFNWTDINKYSANGNVFAANGIVPYAMGGVVDRPTVFPFARGVGLMGEAGPEAIIPLKRGADGKLGVAGGGGGTVVNVSVDAKGTNVQGDNNQGAALGRVIAGAVQQELIKQKRPGGLLAA